MKFGTDIDEDGNTQLLSHDYITNMHSDCTIYILCG